MMKEILTEGKEGRKKIDMKIKLFLKLSSRENCVVSKRTSCQDIFKVFWNRNVFKFKVNVWKKYCHKSFEESGIVNNGIASRSN